MTTPGVPFPDDALSGEDLSQLDGDRKSVV